MIESTFTTGSSYHGADSLLMSKDQRTAFYTKSTASAAVYQYNLCGDGSVVQLFDTVNGFNSRDVWDLTLVPVNGVDRYLLAACNEIVLAWDLQTNSFRSGSPVLVNLTDSVVAPTLMSLETTALNSEGHLFMSGYHSGETASLRMIPSATLLAALASGATLRHSDTIDVVASPKPSAYFRSMRFDPLDQLYGVTQGTKLIYVLQRWVLDVTDPNQPNATVSMSGCVLPTAQPVVHQAPVNSCPAAPSSTAPSSPFSSSTGGTTGAPSSSGRNCNILECGAGATRASIVGLGLLMLVAALVNTL